MAIVSTDESASLASLQPLWHPKAPDFITELGPDPVSGWTTWQEHLQSRKKPARPPFLRKKKPGDEVTVNIKRGEETVSMKVTLAKRGG